MTDVAYTPAQQRAIASRDRELRGLPSDPDGTSASAPWPSPMAREAFHGLAGEVVKVIEPTTEADPVALLLNVLTYFGNCAGMRPRLLVEDTEHGLNEFLGIVGPTSKARKGTADKRVRRLFRLVDEEWTTRRVKSGLSSGEGLIWAVRDPIFKANPKTGKSEQVDAGEDDKRLLAVENELATVLRRIEREGSSLSPLMRDAWDRMPLDALVSERDRPKARSGTNHISIIGHITRSELARYLSRTEVANGLGNRFIWVCVRRARLLPRGSEPPNLNALVGPVHQALHFADQVTVPIDFDDEAATIWERVYGPLSEGKPGLLGAMIARGEAHVVRLSEIYAVLDRCPEIRPAHLLAALAVWDYAEASARYVFGDHLGDPDQEEVLAALRLSTGGLTRAQLREHFHRNWQSDRIQRAIDGLVEVGLVRATEERTGGRPATRYTATAPRGIHPGGYLALAKEEGGNAVNAINAIRATEGGFRTQDDPRLSGDPSTPKVRPVNGRLEDQGEIPRTYGVDTAYPSTSSPELEQADTAFIAYGARAREAGLPEGEE